MSLLQISATPVQFSETGFQMLIDGKPDPLPRYQVEVKSLAEVMAVVDGMKAKLATIDPAQFAREGGIDFKPNGYKLYARIAQGRAPSGFHKIPNRLFEVRKEVA